VPGLRYWLYGLGLLLIATGWVGLILPALPGMPLLFLGFLAIAWADGFGRIGAWTLIFLGLIAVAATALDYTASAVGARKMGASKWGILGALAGLVIGLPFGLLGILLGPAIGALVAEYLKDPDLKNASRAGAGTLLGFLLGAVLKLILAAVMTGIALLAFFV
jgi:hypothetical protein